MIQRAFHAFGPLATFALMTIASFVATESATADIIHYEDFESAGGYTTSISEFTDNSNDFFLRTNGTNINGNVNYSNIEGSFYFAAQDIDGEGAALPVFIDITNIDISGQTDLWFQGLFAEDDATDGNQDWDTTDYVHIFYRIDGGAYQNLLWFERGFGITAPMVDTDFDGIGDGDLITDAFTTHVASIAGTGSTLDLRFEFNLNGTDEDFALDGITVGFGAIPEPGVAGLLSLVSIGLLARRRRKA